MFCIIFQALVDFMAEIRGNRVSFDQDKIVLTAGATSANETLIFCLAEPGEAFLLPTPYYPGYVYVLLYTFRITETTSFVSLMHEMYVSNLTL